MMRFGMANHRKDASNAFIFFLLLSHSNFVQVSCQTLNSTLHSTEYGLKFAYNGEIVRFTCAVEGNTIAWSSDEYIGSDGSRLEFVSIEQKGTENRIGQTIATLVNVSSVNGLTILESLLQISVRSAFQISSIRCHNVGSDTVKTISFGTNGNTVLTCDQRSACPGETVTCTCITGYSNILAWSSDQLIGPNDARLEFLSTDQVNVIRIVPGSNTSAMLTDISRLNDVVVLFSDLTFVANSPVNILTCVNVHQLSSYSVIVPMSTETCLPVSTTSVPTSTTNDLATSTEFTDFSSSPSGESDVIIGVIVSSSIIIITLAIILTMVVVFHRWKRNNKDQELKRKEDEWKQLKENKENEIEQLKETLQSRDNEIERLKAELQIRENTRWGPDLPAHLKKDDFDGGDYPMDVIAEDSEPADKYPVNTMH